MNAQEMCDWANANMERVEELERDNERLTAEVARLTMMLDEYVRLDNAGKILLEPIGGTASGREKQNDG